MTLYISSGLIGLGIKSFPISHSTAIILKSLVTAASLMHRYKPLSTTMGRVVRHWVSQSHALLVAKHMDQATLALGAWVNRSWTLSRAHFQVFLLLPVLTDISCALVESLNPYN